MNRLARSIADIDDRYDVVIIGSGYGGGVAASRLARAGQRVCVLERGREFLPGEFPDTAVAAAKAFQVDLPGRHVGSSDALYDMRVNQDINVFVGCGLGGTSLVNANVSLRADSRVFDDPRWPTELREEAGAGADTDLGRGFARAEAMLGPVPYPSDQPELPKLRAHLQSGAALGERCYRTPINVTFETGVNHFGVAQSACVLCGDCVSGCNYGAKNTTAMNYLPDAVNHGAELYTEARVEYVAKDAEGWRVCYTPGGLGREAFDAPPLFVLADVVVIAAGTLGSTEILLRSREAGLGVSEQLGARFTGNGDVLAFGYNTDQSIDGIGFGDRPPGAIDPVGPCITSVIDTRRTGDLDEGMVIEEGSVPGALAPIMPAMLSATAKLLGEDTDEGLLDALAEKARELESVVRGAYHGAVRNTQTYLVMTHDDSDGRMVLRDDRLRVEWSGVGDKPIFARVKHRLVEATKALGGTFVPNPTWNALFNHQLVTVHPLGGCCMAEDATDGVVNHKSQVFSDPTGADVHAGLYVCDGSVIPRSLGVNPLFTISAVAERACTWMARDRGWADDQGTTSRPTGAPAQPRLGIQFTETMRGSFSPDEHDDFARGATLGEQSGSTFEFTLTVVSDDLETMLSSEAHAARMLGTVNAPAFSNDPLVVTGGRFNLFVRDPDTVGQRRMCYRMRLTDVEGRRWFFSGYKLVHDDYHLDAWADTTTLYITVYDGEDESAPVHGKGILTIHPDDFARQLTTMKARNARSKVESLEAVARFGRFFSGVMAETYGGAFAPMRVHDPRAPARDKRPLAVGDAEIVLFETSDGVSLRLTRYHGGDKGPVMLSHGLGVSSLIFSIDTINPNLLETLFAQGYDVWLLDYRASISLPASNARFTGDDIATLDYPAAIAEIRARTGAESVQVMAHCFGSTTFFMAMLAGLEGVRSAVISQIATHMRAPVLSRLKAGLHLPSLLDTLGVDSLTAYVDAHSNWLDRLYDGALRLYPQEMEERTNSAVDKRITFMYGQLWELDQLNTATHDNLHELFGVANIACFEHLARMLREGHIVDSAGHDVYLPHLDRLAIPITIVHGAENQTFLPASTEITYRMLCARNGPDLYQRHLIAGYGHIDCIFGKNAHRDVYPHIVAALDAHQ